MNKIKVIAMSVGLTVVALACVAQEEEEEAGPIAFTYATYFYCSGDMSVVDELTADDADRMNGFVEDGTILRWGWLQHHTGGQWQRAFYYQTETMEELFTAYDALNDDADDDADDDEEDESADDDDAAFSDVCWGHDDYIWQMDNGSNSEQRGPAGFSVYFDCDITREDRAGEIVDSHIAPILNGYVEDGKLASWAWSTHVVGGHIRALHTMTAADIPSLMAARGQSIADIYAEDSAEGAEFADICGSHSDYIWNIQLEN